MPIFARIDGLKYSIRKCEKIRFSEIIISNLEELIDLVNPKIELNFVLNGTLGNEVTKDERIKPLDDSIVNVYNRLRGVVFQKKF